MVFRTHTHTCVFATPPGRVCPTLSLSLSLSLSFTAWWPTPSAALFHSICSSEFLFVYFDNCTATASTDTFRIFLLYYFFSAVLVECALVFLPPEWETLGIWNASKVGAHSARIASLGWCLLKCQYKINQLPPNRGQVLLCGAIEISQPARCKLFRPEKCLPKMHQSIATLRLANWAVKVSTNGVRWYR